MNLIAAAPLWLLVVLGCAMAAAGIEDAVRLRISNLTTLVVLIGAIVAAVIAGPSWSLWQNVAVFAVILLLGTVAFSAGWLGGGDVKLLAATGLWLDLRTAPWFLGTVFLSGGLVALCYIVSRPLRRRSKGSWKSRRIPYGIAIAVGAMAMILFDHGSFRTHPQSQLRNVRLG